MASNTNEYEDSESETLKLSMSQFIFIPCNVLMEARSIPLEFALISIIFMFIQLLGYIYDQRIVYPFNDNWHEILESITGIFRLYPAIESLENANLYWWIIYSSLGLILIYIIQLFYLKYSLKIGKFYLYFPIKIICNMNSIFYWFLLNPII